MFTFLYSTILRLMWKINNKDNWENWNVPAEIIRRPKTWRDGVKRIVSLFLYYNPCGSPRRTHERHIIYRISVLCVLHYDWDSSHTALHDTNILASFLNTQVYWPKTTWNIRLHQTRKYENIGVILKRRRLKWANGSDMSSELPVT